MWNNSGAHGGMTLRPWYYTWQLMCRYFPRNAKILKMSELEDSNDLRIVGARIGNNDYSFAIVNRQIGNRSQTQSITLVVPQTKPYYIYYYNPQNMGDGHSLSIRYETIEPAKSPNGITLNIPVETGAILTTLLPINH